MKSHITKISIFLLMLITFTSCEVVEGIFNLGMGVGIFIVLAILAVIIYIFAKFKKR